MLVARGDGRVAERLKAPVLKTGNGQPFVGSNPTPSATELSRAAHGGAVRDPAVTGAQPSSTHTNVHGN